MIRISVCVGSACHLKGSYNMIGDLQDLIETHHLGEKVEIEALFCMGRCSDAVSVRINGGETESVAPQYVRQFFETRVLPLAKAE